MIGEKTELRMSFATPREARRDLEYDVTLSVRSQEPMKAAREMGRLLEIIGAAINHPVFADDTGNPESPEAWG